MHKKFLNSMKRRNQRLIELGYRDYTAYLASEHWFKRRAEYAVSHQPVCRYCPKMAQVLHHASYDRVGAEADDDLMWLCVEHHDEMHAWGEVVPASEAQKERLRVYGFEEAVVNCISRGVAYNLINEIHNGRRTAPAALRFGETGI